jgi:inositol-pentakisphosphate 2-kinase
MNDMTHLHPRDDSPNNRHVYSVEIKPKWGILCRSGYVENESIKKHVCRYCMHQHFKLGKGEISRPSQFCPLDLFAPDQERVKRAIENLIDDPQNNMRLYVNGELLWYGHMKQPSNSVSPDYKSDLRRVLQDKHFSQQDPINDFMHLLQRCLSESGVLRQIRRMQLFDKMDVEAANLIFSHLTQRESIDKLHKPLFDFDLLESDASDNWLAQLEEEFTNLPHDVDFFCKHKYKQVFDFEDGLSKQSVQEMVNKCLQDDNLARHALRMFLLGQCAKDCSIMICFERNENNHQDLHFKVGVVDMDPKPVNKIPHYMEMDRAIMKTFLTATMNN